MDYKHRFPDNRYRPQQKSRGGLWAVIALVVAVMAGAGGWYAVRQLHQTESTDAPVPEVEAKTPAATGKPGDAKAPAKKPANPQASKEPAKPAQNAKPPEPRFTFYKILPEKEAIIPESEITNLKREESQSKRPSAAQYLIQAGSFASPQEAVKLKEKLSALKIKSHIENVKIENVAWNRVKIGPFSSLADADKVRTYLRNNQIDSVVQKAVTAPPPAKPNKAKPATAPARH